MTVKCPYCGSDVVGAKCLDGTSATPKKGDYSVCASCGEVLVFANDKGTIRKITIQEEVTMPDDVRDVISHIQVMVKGKARRKT